jgi:2-desacetyl-2-hydroxyethyl bacteriochlorophyllide A dehydrogenase
MTSETARAFWITQPGNGELRPVALAERGPDDVEIETHYSGISRGTEALVFNGQVPESEYKRMRAPFQDGDFPAPVKYGYVNVGRVTAGAKPLLGRDVFCLYPHQTRYVVPAAAVTVIPDSVPAARAVLASNLETAVNGLWDAAPRVGDRIAVIGAGTVGCLVAWLAARHPGTQVQLIDIDERKAAVANALGVSFASPTEARAQAHPGDEADLVIHASGSAEGLRLALDLAGFEAKIVEMSWFGAKRVELPLGESFHSKRLRIVSSQVASIATAQRERWNHARRMALVMRLLGDASLDRLISGESRFDDLPDVMRRLADSGAGSLCHRITYL